MSTTAYELGSLREPTFRYCRRILDGRVLGGVCTGLAHYFKLPVFWVRLGFALSGLLLGPVYVLYVISWLLLKPESQLEKEARLISAPPPPPQFIAQLPKPIQQMSAGGESRLVGWILVLLASGSTLTLNSWSLKLFLPFAALALGLVVMWRFYDQGLRSRKAIAAWIVGALLVLIGCLIFISGAYSDRYSARSLNTAFIALLTGFLGLLIVLGPAIVSLWNNLTVARGEAMAAAERARIAAHLHDSVLQTLALIQKQADDSETVIRLARRQERELRQWLFDSQKPYTETVFAALLAVCGEVEDLYGLNITPVTVGTDQQLNANTQAVVDAAREALVNVAKHSGASSANIYAELSATTFELFIRDRGLGFDLNAVEEGHHGIKESMYARVERVGGTVKIRSTPGEGTEVHFVVGVS
ncbi:ATP-binding protein [Corynebacterium caspium]|uniref:ATP-binding protein n=1 Tax=Corynebacterium caspium TaxID=234828 RepID=UPI00037B7E72|nr:ATP-binding protein [Corynebacterium caspium]WKD59781.1 Sensor histidine kinase LiaS [Corynebacterium caspium DSM 44850]